MAIRVVLGDGRGEGAVLGALASGGGPPSPTHIRNIAAGKY